MESFAKKRSTQTVVVIHCRCKSRRYHKVKLPAAATRYVKNPSKIRARAAPKFTRTGVKFLRRACARARACRPTVLYFIFSLAKRKREKEVARALLANGPRTEVIPDSRIVSHLRMPSRLRELVVSLRFISATASSHRTRSGIARQLVY